MSGGDDASTSLCGRVLDRLADGEAIGSYGPDAILAEHVGSCVTCFRVLGELRDAARIGELLRVDAAALPAGDAFWDGLAARTARAAAAALGGGPRPSAPAPAPIGRRPARARAGALLSGLAVAAAAMWALTVHRRGAAPVVVAAPTRQLVATAPRLPSPLLRDDADDADVADLDGAALRRLLERLRARTPPALATTGTVAADDALSDDDTRVDDELADLDGPALRRVALSLAVTP